MQRQRLLRLLAASPVVLIALAGTVNIARSMAPVPADLDLARERLSEKHLFKARLDADGPIPVGTMTSVTVRLETPAGKPIEKAVLSISGGMPQHGHGLPTKPRATAELSPGRYRIDGVRFSMSGWWTFSVSTHIGATEDTATFNLKLED